MWRRLLRDDKHKTSPARRRSFLLEGIGLCLESLGAATRQACDLSRVRLLALDKNKNLLTQGPTGVFSAFSPF
ncbi:hypothetical protein C1N70_05770 [Cytobacillus firmus]